VQQRRQGEGAHPRNREGARNDCECDQERTGGGNLLHEGGAKEDPRGIRHHPSERDAAVSRGDSGPVSAKASRGESGEARGGGGDAEEATQAGIREGKRDEAPRRHEDKGDSDGRDAGKEGATLSESSTERGARDSENRNEQTDRAKRGREKKGGATEGIESASGKLEDGFIRFKLKAKIPVKEETTVKIQGKTVEEVKAKLVRTLDIENRGTTEPGDSHEKRRSRPREQELRAAENVGNGAENDDLNGVEKEAECHVDRSGDRG
jgi:hypothetical protein